MAGDIITYARGIRVGERDFSDIEEIIGLCMAALKHKSIPKLEKNIGDLLLEIKYTYCNITQQEPANNYSQLIKETLQAFAANNLCERSDYYRYLETLVKIIEKSVLALSVTYGLIPGYNSYISDRYDRLITLERRIENILLSGLHSGRYQNQQSFAHAVISTRVYDGTSINGK